MNRKLVSILGLSILLTMVGISMPVYGKETSMKREGNINGIGGQIINMKADYVYLENEIQKLLEECK